MFRRLTLLFMILTSFCLLNAQKTIQHYMKPQGHIGDDVVVCTGTSISPSYPFVIVNDDAEPINEDPPAPVEMSFGEIPYSIETTSSGQVHLNIPINSFASEYEFAPQLSLDYNSGRNSYEFLGKGWTLKGLPVVSRVSKDFFTDGSVEGVSLTDNHLFALDGERLIFQNESDGIINFLGQTSNVKVQFIDNQSFKVLYPDGNIATMNCTDSINYYVTNLRQKDGQEIRYYYTSTGNEQKHISSIYYGDNKRMVFNYFTPESGVESVDYYCAGKLFKKRYKLKDITIFNDNIENDTITRYYLWNLGKVEDPLAGIEQHFDDGKYYFPMEFFYRYNESIDLDDIKCDTLTNMLYDTNPEECVIQRGKFSHYSDGEGFLMFKNRDSYYFDYDDQKYRNGYNANGQIIVAHNSNMRGGKVPCSSMTMGEGFVDAFTANTDGIHGEEIVVIRNWKPDGNNYNERLYLDIYSADNNILTLKDSIDVRDTQLNSSVPLYPKTFLTGDFTGDGNVELLIVNHYYPNSLIPTTYRLVSLENGAQIKKGDFYKHYFVKFPEKFDPEDQLDPYILWNNYKRSAKFFPIDYNGDGKIEVGVVDSLGMKIYEFYKNNSGNLGLRVAGSSQFPSLYDLEDYALKIGEFNGDGIADMLLYLETDTINLQTQKLYKSYLGKGDGEFTLKDEMSMSYTSVYPSEVVLQPNGDGITDMIVRGKMVTSVYPSPYHHLEVYNMRNGIFNGSSASIIRDSMAFAPAYFYGECNDVGFLTVDKQGILSKYTKFVSRDATWKLTGLRDSYHNNYNISYRRVYESDDYHPDFGHYQFPYTTFANGQLACHRMKKYDTSNNIVEDRNFNYGDAVIHQQGWGNLGFDNIAIIDSISGRVQETNYNVLLMGAPTRKENYNSINYFSHDLTITSDKRIQLWNTGMSHYDKGTCSSDTTCFFYDQYGNITLAQTTLDGGLEKTVQSQYINQTDGNVNIIGLPSKVTTTLINANGSVVSGAKYTYNSNYLITSEKKFFGNENQVVEEVQRTYDSQNRITQEKKRKYSSPWSTTTFSFSEDNRKPSSLIDPRGWSYDMTYGKFGVLTCCEYNISQLTPLDPIGSLHGDDINGVGFPIAPNPIPFGLETSYDYDEAGNLNRVTNPDGTVHDIHRTWIYQNIGIGAKFFVTDSVTGQPVTRTYYNSLGQKTRVETQRPDSSFLKVDYEYDAMGRLIKQYEPYKTDKTLFTLFEYDAFDRLVSKTNPDGHSDTYTYNGLTTASNVEGITSSRTVDDLGNLVSITDPGGTISYSMAADGRPLSISINGEASTTFEYDSYGRKTAINDPSAGRISYSYDSSGNIATVTDARGKITVTTYNDFGKPTSSTIDNDMTVTYSYNSYQQPTAVTCSNGNSKQYTYNKFHKLTSETINGFKRSYNYSGGNVASIGYSLNNASLGTEQYVRTRGTLTAINYGGKTLWRLDGEDDHAMPTAVSSSVVSTSLEYDDMHRVTSRIAATGTSGTIHDMQYEYDTYGSMTGREDGIRDIAEDFGYDNLGRLVSAPDGDITYDSKGNITVHDAAGVYGYDPARPYALSQITLTASGFPSSEQAVSYNSMNRPDTISERGTVACLKYFEDGERSQMTMTGRELNCTYRYFGNQFTVIDNNLTGSQKETQVLFLGGDAYNATAALVREKANNSFGWSQKLYYIVRDNLGSITHVVDSTGAVAQELSYDAWGRLRDPETQQVYAPGNQPDLLLGRGYCGHEHMPAFNLLNMNARLYDPWTARFLSPDPYVQLPDFTQSLNRYSYCLNNPLKFVDLSGKIIDDSFMTPLQRIHYWHDIGELRKNKLFNTFYDRIQKSSQIIYVMYGRTHSSEDNSPSEANFDYRNNTICLGMSYDKWDLTEELYHAYQHINNTLIDGHNADYEANVVRLLSISPIATPFESLTEMRVNIALGIYGTDETGSFTIENEKMFVTDYINSGKLFINEPGRDPHYHIPVISCPPLLLELLRTVFR